MLQALNPKNKPKLIMDPVTNSPSSSRKKRVDLLLNVLLILYILVGYVIGVLKYYGVVKHEGWFNAFILQYTLGRASGPVFIAYAIFMAFFILGCRLFNRYLGDDRR